MDGGTASASDLALVARLRAGDEAAFRGLVRSLHASMARLARSFCGPAVADEVVQEAWLGVLQGLDGFEGRSSLKSWVLRILVNTARTRGAREARSVPFSALGGGGDDGPAVDPGQFLPDDHPRWPGHWANAPRAWSEERLLAKEALQVAQGAIDALPPAQREVIVLRDVEGLSSEEACALLGVSEGNQRVLLHRARARVRAALDRHLAGEEGR